MKIYIIRHGRVNMKWEKKYDSKDYDKACSIYDISPVQKIDEKINTLSEEKIYISELSRTFDTASQLFNRKESDYIKTGLLNEVPLRSFMDTKHEMPLLLWNIIGRLQWKFSNKRQMETINQTYNRADKAIEFLERENRDCYVVTHGFFMRVLIKQLKKKEYKITGPKMNIGNLDMIIACKS